ncbi:MAG: diguanylate cyclase [Lachnospiraceae bacterium]|nr:diguanylate cyclase [Lachnospiraceae bacterium]
MKFSLKRKAVILVLVVILVMGSCGFFLVRGFVDQLIKNQYYREAERVADSTAVFIDAERVKRIRDEVLDIYNSTDNIVLSDQWGTPEFDSYIALYDDIANSEDFQNAAEGLSMVRDHNGVAGVYVAGYDFDNLRAIYYVDAKGEDQCPPGCVDSVEEGFAFLDDFDGEYIKPYTTRTETYGWLVTTGAPIKYNGETIAYLFVDVSMSEMMAVRDHYSILTALFITLATVVLSIIGIFLMNRYMIKPIEQLSDVAATYAIKPADKMGELERCDFANIDINTGDEIQVLAESMKKMERDLNEQIESLFATRQELISTREHAEILNEIANRDALTGIRNKRGYDVEVQRLNRNIATGFTDVAVIMVDMNDLKIVNDKYGHEVGDKVICNLCDTLCSLFKRSPVFRIGGDEFVVVAENQDFINLESNVDKFCASIERSLKEKELEPWQRVGAAIGYAVYDKDKDCGIEDTLNRADEMMLKNKREMKEYFKEHFGDNWVLDS